MALPSKTLPPIEMLQEWFRYEPDTGNLTWTKKRHIARPGDVAGHINFWGYLRVRFNKKQYAVHRLIWKMHHGIESVGEIDHVNGIKTDNRIANLHDVPVRINQLNRQGPNKNNKSTGVLGVTRTHNKFMARIRVNGKLTYLGLFPNVQSAGAAYQAAKALIL